MDDVCNCLFGMIGHGSGLIETYGAAVVERALELAKGQPPEANLMPYIYRVLEEARASENGDGCR